MPFSVLSFPPPLLLLPPPLSLLRRKDIGSLEKSPPSPGRHFELICEAECRGGGGGMIRPSRDGTGGNEQPECGGERTYPPTIGAQEGGLTIKTPPPAS